MTRRDMAASKLSKTAKLASDHWKQQDPRVARRSAMVTCSTCSCVMTIRPLHCAELGLLHHAARRKAQLLLAFAEDTSKRMSVELAYEDRLV